MPIRLRYKLAVTVSSDSTEEKDLGNNAFEVVNDEQNEGGTWKSVIAANTTDVQVQLGNVAAATFLTIRSASKDPTLAPAPLAVKLNSTSNTAIDLQPVGSAKEGLMVLTTLGLTALYVSNASSTVMEIIVSAVGD